MRNELSDFERCGQHLVVLKRRLMFLRKRAASLPKPANEFQDEAARWNSREQAAIEWALEEIALRRPTLCAAHGIYYQPSTTEKHLAFTSPEVIAQALQVEDKAKAARIAAATAVKADRIAAMAAAKADQPKAEKPPKSRSLRLQLWTEKLNARFKVRTTTAGGGQ